MIVDRLNNEKGRSKGEKINNNASRKDVISEIIDKWHKEPFYVTEKVENEDNDSMFMVKPIRLGKEYYDAYQKVLPKLDENGNWKK